MEVGRDVKVPSSEFDGKVVYGEKRKGTGTANQHSLYVYVAGSRILQVCVLSVWES